MRVFDFTDLKWYKIILGKFVSLSGFSVQQQRKKEVEMIGRKENEQKELQSAHLIDNGCFPCKLLCNPPLPFSCFFCSEDCGKT